MWSILVIIGSLNYGSQYRSPHMYLSKAECERDVAKMVAGADFVKGKVYNVRCDPFIGLNAAPYGWGK